MRSTLPGIVLLLFIVTGCQSPAPRSDWHAQVAAVAGAPLEFRTEAEPLDDGAALPATLTLEQTIRQALTSSPEIQSALAKVRIAEADADQSRLLPNPVVTLVVRFRHESPIITPSIAEDLVAILRRPAAVRAADKHLRAVTADALIVVLNTIVEAQETFVAVRSNEDVFVVLAERLKLIEKLADVARSRKNAGEGTRLDVLTLDAQRVQLEADVAIKELARVQDRLTLARVLGRPSGATDWVLEAWNPPARLEVGEPALITSALKARPEIQSKLWELSALQDEVALARWSPFVTAQVGAEAEKDIVWSGGPAVSAPLPIFDLGNSRRDRVKAEVIGARHELAQARRLVVEDVRKANATFQLAQTALAKTRDQLLPLQEQRHEQAQASYRAGEADLTTLIIAEQDLQDAKEKVIELRQKAAVAYLRLVKAVGGGDMSAKP